MEYKWYLVERIEQGLRTLGEFTYKRQLVEAMNALKPNSIQFVGKRTYVITVPSK